MSARPAAEIRNAAPGIESREAIRGPRPIPRWLIILFAIVIGATYLGTIGRYSLSDPDEARYAEIPREMNESGDYVTPRLNYFKYFEKPPLFYWLTAASFRLLGRSDFVARLWPVLFAFLGIAVAGVVGRLIYGPRVGALSAAILAASPYYFGIGQFLTLDMPLSGLMNLALGAFWLAYALPQRRREWLVAFYVATALAVLVKGPVAAVLNGGTVVLFLLLRGEWRGLRWLVSPLGIAAFLVVSMPWFVLVSARNPEFVHFFVVKQHLARYLEPREHHQPLWFFVPILLGGMLPWTLLAAYAPGPVWQALRRLAALRVSAGTLYLVVWAAVTFGFFSASGSKLGTYILPMVCPAAVLLARFVRGLLDAGRVDVLRRALVSVIVFAAVALVGGIVADEFLDDWRSETVLAALASSTPIVLVTAIASLATLRRSAEASLAVMLLGVLIFQPATLAGRALANSYPRIGRIVKEQAAPEDLVVGYRHYAHSITLYSQRRVIQVLADGELDFGRRLPEGQPFFWPTNEDLVKAWASGRRIFLNINRHELEELAPLLDPPPREIAAEQRKVLVVNFPGSERDAG
ncbi:glycosyltransferase family 39 protein [Candidatus Binatia bacterium]|nr:glycosyltransferase family 39 protein [Candidatus Binatia bacterium]